MPKSCSSPREGGRWFERDADGAECEWGKVLHWEPPARLLLGWQLTAEFRYDPDFLTEVEVTFEPEGSGTRVTLSHQKLERFGDQARAVAERVDQGWGKLVGLYGDVANWEEVG